MKRKATEQRTVGAMSKNKGRKDTPTEMITVPKAMVSLTNSESSTWILDSGCARHMVNRKEYFNALAPVQGQVQFENQEVMNSEEFGAAIVISIVNGIEKSLTFKDVLHVPHQMYSLVSTSNARNK